MNPGVDVFDLVLMRTAIVRICPAGLIRPTDRIRLEMAAAKDGPLPEELAVPYERCVRWAAMEIERETGHDHRVIVKRLRGTHEPLVVEALAIADVLEVEPWALWKRDVHLARIHLRRALRHERLELTAHPAEPDVTEESLRDDDRPKEDDVKTRRRRSKEDPV